MIKIRILIADDDIYIRAVIKELLLSERYEILEAGNGTDALKSAREDMPDLIILDVIMPGNDGYAICSIIRNRPEIYGNPLILMLTSKNEINDLAKGFEKGADDYLKKPFNNMELELRIKALLKRKNSPISKIYKYNNIVLNIENNHITENGIEIRLTKKEFEMAAYFIVNKGLVLSRDKIMEAVWNKPYTFGNKSVEIFIKQIKEKLADFNDNLETIVGFGYKLG